MNTDILTHGSTVKNHVSQKVWAVGGGTGSSIAQWECAHAGKMLECPKPRLQHCIERQHQLALEWCHDQQGSSLGSEDTPAHLQASHDAGRHQDLYEKLGGRWVSRCRLRKSRVKSGPLRRGPFMMVMSQFCWLFVPFFGGELPLGGEAVPLGAWRGTPVTYKVGFHNRGVQWDTPMARWAGEGNGWIKLMAQRKPRMV